MSEVTVGEIEITEAGMKAVFNSDMQRRREFVRVWFGDRCSDFESTCIVCRMWANQDAFEKMIDCGIKTETNVKD